MSKDIVLVFVGLLFASLMITAAVAEEPTRFDPVKVLTKKVETLQKDLAAANARAKALAEENGALRSELVRITAPAPPGKIFRAVEAVKDAPSDAWGGIKGGASWFRGKIHSATAP